MTKHFISYDKGFDGFIRKFKPDQETSAIVAIVKGFHEDHGSVAFCTQGKRRCLPLTRPTAFPMINPFD
jgi:hypothetical protein